MSRFILWGGSHVGFRVQSAGSKFVRARQRDGEEDMCPICKKYFQTHNTTGIVLIISNKVGVPNRFVHAECMADKTDKETFALIVKDWDAAQQYKDWF